MVVEWKWLNGTCNLFPILSCFSSKVQVASIGIYVQTFFCHRLWKISGKNYWLVVPIAAVLLFAYVSSCLAVRHVFHTTMAQLIFKRVDILHIERRRSWSQNRHLVYVSPRFLIPPSQSSIFSCRTSQLRLWSVACLSRTASTKPPDCPCSRRFIDHHVDGLFLPEI